MMPGRYKKPLQLEVLQGNPGKRSPMGRPDAEAFRGDVRWFMRWSRLFEAMAKAAEDWDEKRECFDMAFKCRVKAVEFKARHCVSLKPAKKPETGWEGLVTASG
jgi:hypothetical protein